MTHSPDTPSRSDYTTQTKYRTWYDKLGIAASTLCAIHCAVTPFLGVAAVSMFTAYLPDHWHTYLLTSMLTFGFLALYWGQVRHKRYWAWVPMLPALLIGVAAHVYDHQLEQQPILHAVVYTVIGMLLIVAHVLNLKLAHGHIHDSRCSTHKH